MTAFAIDFQPRRLTVAGDTLFYAPDRGEARPLGYASKIIPLPVMRAVLFARGMHAITVQAAAALMLDPSLLTIEDAAATLPNLLRQISDNYADQADIDDWRSVAMLELVLAGWSEHEGRMRLWQFTSYQDYAAQDDGGASYGVLPFPRLPAEYMPKASGSSDADLVAIITAAGRLFADHAAEMGSARVGGEVMKVDVTPDGIATRTLYRFEDYEQTRHAGAAVTARVLRGELQVDVAEGLGRVADAVDSETGKPVSMNRQQRRQAERMARKGHKAA